MTDMLEAALKWARKGYPVFPCNPSTKAPLVPAGFRSATTDTKVIDNWWARYPSAMIGVPTGSISGFWVLDIDDPELFERHCPIELPPTRKHSTGKGYHLLFKTGDIEVANAQRQGNGNWPFPQMPGAEVRGFGGYVIVPPSLHPSGKRYHFANTIPIAEPPQELLAIVIKSLKLAQPQVTSPQLAADVGIGVDTSQGLQFLEAQCAAIRSAPNGAQEATLNTAALRAGRFVAMSQLSHATARKRLMVAGSMMVSYDSQNPWRPEQIAKKVDRSLGDGIRNYSTQTSSVVQHEEQSDEGFAPQPLYRELTQGKPYPVEALGPLKDVVETVQALTQAPVALAAQSALAATALAVQGFANVETLGGDRPVSLYAVTIAESGERKSSCDNYFMSPVRQFEEERAKQHIGARKIWQMATDLWKSQRKDLLDEAKSSSTAANAIDRFEDAPIPPRSDDRIVSEPTYEGLTRLFFEGQPSLGIFSDEGGRFLGGFAMNSENRMKTMAALNDLWGGNPIKRTRQGDGSFTLSNRRLSVHLMVQPVIAAPLLADPLASGSGFLARCLVSQPPSTIGTRMHKSVSFDTSALERFEARLASILRTPYEMDERTGALELRCLELSPQAREILVEFANRVEAAQLPGGRYDRITALASKTAEHASRMAGVLTLWTNLRALSVSAQVMQDAVVLAEYYLEEGLRLFGEAELTQELVNAEALRKWMLSPSWNKGYLTLRDVVSRGPKPLRLGPKARSAISLLVQYGWLRPYPSGVILDGTKHKEAWQIISG